MVRDGIGINKLMMPCAHQCEIREVMGKLGRSNGIAMRTAFNVSNDVRNEAKDSILATSDEIANEISVAAVILATTYRTCL